MGRPIYSEIVSDIRTGRLLRKVLSDPDYKGPMAEAMARQYFNSPLADSLITPQSAVSPGTTATSIFSIAQSNKYMPLPFGQNAPSPGSIFRVNCGGLCTTVAGTNTFTVYHGPGTTTTAFGTALAASSALTTVAATAGNWRLEGVLIYRSISELATTSTAWFSGLIVINGPSSGTVAPVIGIIQSTAAVSVDTTGTGSSGTFGSLNLAVLESVTASTWTPEWAFMEHLN